MVIAEMRLKVLVTGHGSSHGLSLRLLGQAAADRKDVISMVTTVWPWCSHGSKVIAYYGIGPRVCLPVCGDVTSE